VESHSYFSLDKVEWRAFGHNTKGVFFKDVSTRVFREGFNVSLFRVKPDGEVPRHRHSHAHVLYFLSGEGECWVGAKTYEIKPGDVALVDREVEHGYKNTGDTDLLLVVLNAPATR
jgi:quercetin dioxygenase-like cupin family protein